MTVSTSPSRHPIRLMTRPRIVVGLLSLLLLTGLVLAPVLAAKPPPGAWGDVVLRGDDGHIDELVRPRRLGGVGVTLIGRAGTNDIRLKDDTAVQGEHARITITPDGDITLENLDTKGATFVNGAPVGGAANQDARVSLQVGDRLGFGFSYDDVQGLKIHNPLHLLRRDQAPLPATVGAGELAVSAHQAAPDTSAPITQLRTVIQNMLWPRGSSEPKVANGPELSARAYEDRLRMARGMLSQPTRTFEWWGRKVKPGQPVTQLYLNALPETVAELVIALSQELNDAQMPFEIRVPSQLADAKVRADVLTLSVERTAANRALSVVQHVVQDQRQVKGEPLADGHPALTKPIAKGIAVAAFAPPSPPFGERAATSISQAIDADRQQHKGKGADPKDDPVRFTSHVSTVLASLGIDPHHPWGDALDPEGAAGGAGVPRVQYKDYSCATTEGSMRSQGTIRVKFGSVGAGPHGPTVEVEILYLIRKQSRDLPRTHDDADISFTDAAGTAGTVNLATDKGREDGEEHPLEQHNKKGSNRYTRRLDPQAGPASFSIVFDRTGRRDRGNCSVTIPVIKPPELPLEGRQVLEYGCGIRGDLDGTVRFEFDDAGNISRLGFKITSGSLDDQKGKLRVYDDETSKRPFAAADDISQDNELRYFKLDKAGSWRDGRWRFVFRFGRNNWPDADCVAVMPPID